MLFIFEGEVEGVLVVGGLAADFDGGFNIKVEFLIGLKGSKGEYRGKIDTKVA